MHTVSELIQKILPGRELNSFLMIETISPGEFSVISSSVKRFRISVYVSDS
jgi:hypothetical protein